MTPRQELLETCRAVTGVESEIVWVDAGFLVEHGVEQWMELPMWLHEAEYAAMQSTPRERALAAGLRTRPLAETARDTLAWVQSGQGAHGSARRGSIARRSDRYLTPGSRKTSFERSLSIAPSH